MSAILKFDFQKRKQLRFSEVNYLQKAVFCLFYGFYVKKKNTVSCKSITGLL